MPNLYGDIISDLCAGLVGGWASSAAGTWATRPAVFEAVHGTAPDIAGRNVANPMALLMSAIMMLRHIGERDRADAVMQAMVAVLAEGTIRTRDLGGHVDHDGVRRRHLTTSSTGAARPAGRHNHQSMAMTRSTEDITQAVMARPEVTRLLQHGHGEDPTVRAQVLAYLDELRTTQRYPFYRRCSTRSTHPAQGDAPPRARRDRSATRRRATASSTPRPSQPPRLPRGAAVLDDNGIRPPSSPRASTCSGPARPHPQARHRRRPIRRATKDPVYLTTLKATSPNCCATTTCLLSRGRAQLTAAR